MSIFQKPKRCPFHSFMIRTMNHRKWIQNKVSYSYIWIGCGIWMLMPICLFHLSPHEYFFLLSLNPLEPFKEPPHFFPIFSLVCEERDNEAMRTNIIGS